MATPPHLALLDGLERVVHAVNSLFVAIASVLVVGIVIVTVREVILRYGFNDPSLWAMDGARYALSFVFFLALGPALQSGHHVTVDLFDRFLPERLKPYQPVTGYLLTLAFATVLLRYTLDLTIEVFETGEMTFAAVPVALKYVYWIGPVGALQFWLTALVGLVRAGQALRPGPAMRGHGDRRG